MKLNLAERLMTNSPLRAFSQRYIEVPALRRMARRDRYPACLEIGCGRGYGARLIAAHFDAERVVAVDMDPAQIEHARKRLPAALSGTVEFRVGDAMALDETDDAFDAAFSFGVLHHMENWRRAVEELARVLRPGGELFYIELFRSFLTSLPVRLLTDHPEGGLFSLEEFTSGLERAGLSTRAVRRMGALAALGAAVKSRA
jgi:ubiquinone/menaquinone biosynthesis C-methylase UbiE